MESDNSGGTTDETRMTWIEKYAQEQCAASPEFKAAYEKESAILALVHARDAVETSREDGTNAVCVD